MAKYATNEHLISCPCGIEFAKREGRFKEFVGATYKAMKICCPRCGTMLVLPVLTTKNKRL